MSRCFLLRLVVFHMDTPYDGNYKQSCKNIRSFSIDATMFNYYGCGSSVRSCTGQFDHGFYVNQTGFCFTIVSVQPCTLHSIQYHNFFLIQIAVPDTAQSFTFPKGHPERTSQVRGRGGFRPKGDKVKQALQ